MKTLFNTPSLKLWRTGTNLKKLLIAALFACFACNGLQAMFVNPGVLELILEEKRIEEKRSRNHLYNLKESNLSILPDDILNLIILEALKNGVQPNNIASISQHFNELRTNIIQNICDPAEIKIENNDHDFDQWFYGLEKYEQNIIKKRLNILAKEYVNTKTEEELNLLPNTIFKRIFINKWFWLKIKEPKTKIKRIIDKICFWTKNQNPRFLNNTLPTNFDIQKFNQRINNINNGALKNLNHDGALNLNHMNITDEILELILEILIENDFANKITTLYLHNNELESIPENFGYLTQLITLFLDSNQLITLPESFGNLNQLGCLILSNNQLTTEIKDLIKTTFPNKKIHLMDIDARLI